MTDPDEPRQADNPTQPLLAVTEQARAQPWIDLEMQQLEAGAYRANFGTLSSGNLHLVHEQQNRLVQKTGVMPKNLCTISMAYATARSLQFSQFSNPMDSWPS
ncbi:MAG: hypothetical protein ACLFSG_09205 [Halothiobacillaceae bacterium]